MKNKLFKASTLFCLVLALSGCDKDTVTTAQSGESTYNALDRLRSFRKQIEAINANPEARNSETITLDDALWGVENNFNLTYSDAECYYSQINEHEFCVSIPSDGQQQVFVYDAVCFYNEVVGQARDALLSDAFDDKGFISLTVKEVSTDSRGTVVTFSGKTGERSSYNHPIAHVDGPFGEDDDWNNSVCMPPIRTLQSHIVF